MMAAFTTMVSVSCSPTARVAVRSTTRDDPAGHRNPGNQLTRSPPNPVLDTLTTNPHHSPTDSEGGSRASSFHVVAGAWPPVSDDPARLGAADWGSRRAGRQHWRRRRARRASWAARGGGRAGAGRDDVLRDYNAGERAVRGLRLAPRAVRGGPAAGDGARRAGVRRARRPAHRGDARRRPGLAAGPGGLRADGLRGPVHRREARNSRRAAQLRLGARDRRARAVRQVHRRLRPAWRD